MIIYYSNRNISNVVVMKGSQSYICIHTHTHTTGMHMWRHIVSIPTDMQKQGFLDLIIVVGICFSTTRDWTERQRIGTRSSYTLSKPIFPPTQGYTFPSEAVLPEVSITFIPKQFHQRWIKHANALTSGG